MLSKFLLFVFIIKHIYKLRKQVVLYQIVTILLSVLQLIIVTYYPSFLQELAIKTMSFNLKILVTTIPLLLILFFNIINSIIIRRITIEQKNFESYIHIELNNYMMEVPLELIEDSDFISLKESALFPFETRDIIEKLFTCIPSIIQSFLSIVSVSLIIIYMDAKLLLIVIALTLLNVLTNKFFIKKQTLETQISVSYNKAYVYYLKTIRNFKIAKDVRIYGIHNFLMDKIEKQFSICTKCGENIYKYTNFRLIINQLINISIIGATYIYLLILIINKHLRISSFILLYNACITLSLKIYKFVDDMLILNSELVYLEPYSKLLDLLKEQITVKGDNSIGSIESIEFRSIYFKYPKSINYVLSNVSFKIDKNTSVAIVGKNGSGKSTIIKLLLGLYKPTKGEILINGKNIESYNINDRIGCTFQDFKIFNFSILDNIIFRNKLDEKKLKNAILEGELSQELTYMTEGLDTLVSKDFNKKGITLSKGQEQKVALTRSIYHLKDLLLLDEPTASLDIESEERLYNNFASSNVSMKVLVSHRLSSCKKCDKIIFLTDGTISEYGNHDSLIRLNGFYKNLYDYQASQYELD